MRMLNSLVGELALRGRLVLSFPRAKAVKRLFLKMQSLETRGHHDRVRGLLNISKKAIQVTSSKAPFLISKKVFSRPYKLRVNNSTRLMELIARVDEIKV